MDSRQMEQLYQWRIQVKGRVQGVGFRPFVFQLAERLAIHGEVSNGMQGVKILAIGTLRQLEAFETAIRQEPPRLARIYQLLRLDEQTISMEEAARYPDFTIVKSDDIGTPDIFIPVDTAVCDDCLREMNDPHDRRYHYPFINCTQCGPRYTIIHDLPYDRPLTSMVDFPMCSACEGEYMDPHNRRHHAQPIACEACGPTLEFYWVDHKHQGWVKAEKEDPLSLTKRLLKEGKILAIKGLGGYHLACDAFSEETIRLLREGKHRLHKPFAVMMKDMETVRRYCEVTPAEEKVLRGIEAPITILTIKEEAKELFPPSLAPYMNSLGVMLPYTPLHHLLFDDELTVLVMTSGNESGLPISSTFTEAMEALIPLVDGILTHDREILQKIDDSVVRLVDKQLVMIRRSRGYAPDPIFVPENADGIIAYGGNQKNVFAIGKGEMAFLGGHIGDIDSQEMLIHFIHSKERLQRLMGVTPQLLVADLHPEYATTRQALKDAELFHLPLIQVQHHHAHMVSIMAEHQLNAPALALVLDGTGWGDDGTIWGMEVLYGDARDSRRMGHLAATPLPGGEKAIREPWRNAVGMVLQLLGHEGLQRLEQLPAMEPYLQQIPILQHMVERRINTPMAGTCGRLFDAVSALLGLCTKAEYEGEAAVQLSELVKEDGIGEPYSFILEADPHNPGVIQINHGALLHELLRDIEKGVDSASVALNFHETVVQMGLALLEHGRKQLSEKEASAVLFSGGSMVNPYLRRRFLHCSEERGWQVYMPEQVPANDGGLALGQLLIAAAQRARESTLKR